MTFEQGLGMLLVGLIAIAIGAFVTYHVINKLERKIDEKNNNR